MSDPFRNQAFPRGALLGVAALIGFALVAVGAARLADFRVGVPAAGAAAQVRELRFVDEPGGVVQVYDGDDSTPLATLAPGTENFIRGVLRGLARERRSHGLGGTQAPFRVARYPDGRLTLEDPATGRLIELQAFGPTNAGAFERLLDASPVDS
jgi:putative photosynthetic complex assembly protein